MTIFSARFLTHHLIELVSTTHAASWLSVIPSEGLGLHLGPFLFQVVIKWWLNRTHQSAPNVPYALEAHWITLAISGRALEAHWTASAITWSCPGSSLDCLGHQWFIPWKLTGLPWPSVVIPWKLLGHHMVMTWKLTGPPRPSHGHALEAHWTASAIVWSWLLSSTCTGIFLLRLSQSSP